MATTRKRPAKKSTKKVEEKEVHFEPEVDPTPLPTTIETRVVVDSIEYERDEERPDADTQCRVTFHALLPEHIAQHLFAHHVQEGGITIEFQPANPQSRKRDMLVRR